MHSKTMLIEGEEWNLHHNGDYSGDVVIFVESYHPVRAIDPERVTFVDNSAQRASMSKLIHDPIRDLLSDGYEVKIPFEIMKRLVAEKLRMDMVTRLEEMDEDQLLSTRVRVDLL